MAARLLLGLVGCGRWGRLILRDLVALGCDVAVVTRTAESRRAAAAGGAFVVTDRVEGLPAVAGAVVATPTTVHAESVRELLPRGIPIFVEKPLCANVAQAREIVQAAPDRVFVMDKWRYHAGVTALVGVARAGEIGRVHGLHTFRGQWGIPHADCDVVWILAPHDLAIARDVLGHIPEPRVAHAECVDGRVVALTARLGDAPWMTLEVSSRYPGHRRELRLHGSEGVAVLDDAYADHLLIRREGAEDAERRAFPADLPLYKELAAFVEHLRGGPPPRSSASEGLEVVEVIDALRRLAGVEAS